MLPFFGLLIPNKICLSLPENEEILTNLVTLRGTGSNIQLTQADVDANIDEREDVSWGNETQEDFIFFQNLANPVESCQDDR